MRRSKVNLTHTHLTTAEMGKLIPFFTMDCLPGDIVKISNKSIHKAQPMVAPLMHQIDIITQYYFVPYRLLWENWVPFITGGENGEETPTYPTINFTNTSINTLADYIGVPTEQTGAIEFSAMPFRAYNKIWNDHYKIDDIETDIEFALTDGNDTITPTDLLNCHWARDKFTRAKPFTQRGSQITVPIQPALVDSYAYPITLKTIKQNGKITTTKPDENTSNIAGKLYTQNNILKTYTQNEISTTKQNYIYFEETAMVPEGCINKCYIPVVITQGDILSYSENPYAKAISLEYINGNNTITNFNSQLESTSQNKISTGKIGSLNIRDLRIASAMQRFQEKSLKYGAEYEDYCRMEFKVTPRDSRLQKSEYLGGSKSILQISEVFQTTDSAETPLGAQAGYGIGQLKQRRIKYFCPEHGIIIGLLSYRPATIYSQGIEREFLKRNRFDYFTREFVDIGAQEILEQEIYATSDNKDKVFGYDLTGNYREYHSKRNRITGNFKTDLSFWTLARKFDQTPVLNSSFMKMEPSKDIFAVTDQTMPAFMTMIQNQIIAYRPIPKRSRNLLK